MNNHSDTLQREYEKTFKKNQELEGLVAALAKEARAALVLTNAWQQEFQGNEILGVIAMYTATRKVVAQKEAALSIAIEFIGQLESGKVDLGRSVSPEVAGLVAGFTEGMNKKALDVLEKINQALVAESIDQSISKEGGENENIIIT